MGHNNLLRDLLERFGLTHLSQVAMVSATALSLAAVGLSASQTLMRDTNSGIADANPARILPAPDLNQVSAAQLFGARSADAGSEGDELPSTRLQWVLQGVFTGTAPENGSAIILAGDQSAKLFKAQQAMPGGAELSEVHADHVVISIDGRRETLRFPTISSLPRQEVAPQAETTPVMNLAEENISNRREIVRQRLEMLRQRAMNRQ